MERLEAKRINGHTYYYYSKWQYVDGRCRRVWQRYLGKLQDIVRAVDGNRRAPQYAEVFRWGLPQALWKECRRAEVVERIDGRWPKRSQGLSTGQYLAIAAVNRAMEPKSKRSLWDWFAGTVLLRHLPKASKPSLSSQRFWDHMDRIPAARAAEIWSDILRGVVERERLDLSSICYDGTNFYTFIDTFNVRCTIAKRGKNKQGRSNLRQVSYALFCCADGHLPLFYDVYEGNRNDAKQFPLVLRRFHKFFRQLSGNGGATPDSTLIFDKGNNSEENFHLIDELKLSYVGSVKLGEHKELAEIPSRDGRFEQTPDHPDGTKSFRVRKRVYGKERTLVVTYNQNLFHQQWLTLQNDIAKAVGELGELARRLEDRRSGLIRGGRVPTVASLQRQCKPILRRQYLQDVIALSIEADTDQLPRLHYRIDADAVQKLSETHLGKTILITDREAWDDARIIRAYRSQFLIEDVFKQSKDRTLGTWWPQHHWTDSKIHVHGLYCTIAVLLRGLAWRRAQQAGMALSMKRFLAELDDIREVINVSPRRRGQKDHQRQLVRTKTSELQDHLISVLGIDEEETAVLG
jgi:transposase